MKIKFCLSMLILVFSAAEGANNNEETWLCPDSWKPFTARDSLECLWTSSSTSPSYDSAYTTCVASAASLVSVFSEEKLREIQSFMNEMNADTIWTGLRHTGADFKWQTVDGWKEMTYQKIFNEHNRWYYNNALCGIISRQDGSFEAVDCWYGSKHYICEKRAECKPGWYGSRCQNQCHCHGQVCDSTNVNATCLFGCEVGWMGESCNIKKRKASVVYHCVKPEDGEKHVSLIIDNKGIDYRVIQAVTGINSPIPWCNGTDITKNEQSNIVTIKIGVTEDVIAEMGTTCAGKSVASDTYEWLISFKEFEGIVMPADMEVLIRCDFNQAETLSRTGSSIATGEEIIEETEQTRETKENVVLELSDAASKRKLFSSSVGASVILKIRYGFEEGSMVKSVSPYSCVASSTDGNETLVLLDANGCQVDGSPVKPFAHNNDTNNLETPWFPYFAFHGSPDVKFQCSFIFCYDNNCPAGCNQNGLWVSRDRHVRSIKKANKGQLFEWTSVIL